MQEVQAMCSRAVIISSGKIVADDKIEKLVQVNTQGALLVTFEQEVDKATLQSLPKVSRVEGISSLQWRLITDKPEELRKEVMQWALTNDININSLQTDTQSLEEVFRSLTK